VERLQSTTAFRQLNSAGGWDVLTRSVSGAKLVPTNFSGVYSLWPLGDEDPRKAAAKKLLRRGISPKPQGKGEAIEGGGTAMYRHSSSSIRDAPDACASRARHQQWSRAQV